MSREEYQDQLEALRTDVSRMGELAVSRFQDAIDVCKTGDPSLAESVIDGDHQLNERYLSVESDCVSLIAQQQPVASDLRFVAASFKIVTDLERIGDLATNLASYGSQAEEPDFVGVEIEPLGDLAADMVVDALDAYEHGDAPACRAVDRLDDDLDAACQRAMESVVRSLIADDPVERTGAEIEATVEDASRALLTIRDVERVGDHAVNVAARTLYMVENDAELIY
ncbi:phosphate signaling complex protein PhoU [Halobacteriales archaeon Cl-PHB]